MSEALSIVSAIFGLPLEVLVVVLAMGILVFAGYCVHIIHVQHNRKEK